MIDSLNDGLQPDFVKHFLCVYIDWAGVYIDWAGIFEKLIRILLLMNISGCL